MEGIGFDVINLLQLTGQVINALGNGRGSPHHKYKQAKEASTSLQLALNGLKAAPQVDANLSLLYNKLLRHEQQIQDALKEYDAALSRNSKFQSFRGIWFKLKFEFSEAAKLLDQINRAQPLVHAAILQGQGQILSQLSTVCDRLDLQNTATVSLQKQVQEGFTRGETRMQNSVRELSGQADRSNGVLTDELRLQHALATMNRRRLEHRLDSTNALVRSTLNHVSTEITRSSGEIKRLILQNGHPSISAALAAESDAAGLCPSRGTSSLDRPAFAGSIADSSSFELLAALVWRVLILFSYLAVLPAEVAKIVDNRIEIETAHGNKLRIPWEYWQSPETLHGFLLFHFRDDSSFEYVRTESYTLFQGGPHGTVVDFTSWSEKVKRKSKLTQVLLVGGSLTRCPRCASDLRTRRQGVAKRHRECIVCKLTFRLGSDLNAPPLGRVHRRTTELRCTTDWHYTLVPSPDVSFHTTAAVRRAAVRREDLSQIIHMMLTVPRQTDPKGTRAREDATVWSEARFKINDGDLIENCMRDAQIVGSGSPEADLLQTTYGPIRPSDVHSAGMNQRKVALVDDCAFGGENQLPKPHRGPLTANELYDLLREPRFQVADVKESTTGEVTCAA